MPTLDHRSVIFVSCLLYLVLSGTTVVFSASLRQVRGTRYWAAGASGFAAFALLIVLRDFLPPWIAIVVSNAGLIASLTLIAHGLAVFVGAPARRRLYPAVCTASVVGLAYFHLAHDSFAARVIVFSLAIAVVAADMVWLVLESRGPESVLARRLVSIVCVAAVGVQGLRIAFTGLVPAQDLFQTSAPVTIALLSLPLLVVALMFSLMVLAASRSAGELEAERARLADANGRLQAALDDVRTLTGLLRVCAWCKRIKDDDGRWQDMEVYLRDRSDTSFTHGVCPECAGKVQAELVASRPIGRS
jgi:hypothetical protein